MKRVGFSLWKGLWLIFVQTDIKICSSVPSPCLQSDPQINTSDLIKFEASYKFYLSWQNKKRFISSVAFTLYCDGLRSVWWDQYCGLVHIRQCREMIMGTMPVTSRTKLCTV